MVSFTGLQLLAPAILSLTAGVSSYPSSSRSYPGHGVHHGKAIYFITNEQENGVAALPIGPDGTLSKGTITHTGGSGSVALGSDGLPATPDGLLSQSALAISGHHIFAVNPGSNSLTMLAISPSDPTQLNVVGSPVSLPGEFPNTVAVSKKNKLVCVGMTGVKAGISCSTFSKHGLGPMDELRPFEIGQTTPPVGPPNTVSHTFFSGDESFLLTTVKGVPPMNITGFLSAFSVEETVKEGVSIKSLSKVDVRSSPEDTAVLFGSELIPGTSNVFTTDPSFGAAILSVDATTHEGKTLHRQPIDGQMATCWAAISPVTHTAFVTDILVNRIVEMSLEDASIVSTLDLSANGDQGLLDLQAAGNFIYALAPNNGSIEAAVTVLDVSGGPGSAKLVQHFGLGGFAGQRSQGLVTLV
ncbi:hypothetical protein FDECE_7170 [Fusarium decemcellulare]|nr:hypothetical protein FDECE_7170 [Fusarium decemcellulare]